MLAIRAIGRPVTKSINRLFFTLILYLDFFTILLFISFRLGFSIICFLILFQSSVIFTLVQLLFCYTIQISSFLSTLNITRNIAHLVTVINIATPDCVWKYSYRNFFINVNSHPIYWITIKTYQSLYCVIFWSTLFGVSRKNWLSCSNGNLSFIR